MLHRMKAWFNTKVRARDGDVGSVSDFVFDDERWAIFYLIVDTGNWFRSGRKVLLSPTWVEAIDWTGHDVEVDLSRETIKNSPPFDAEDLIDRSYEKRLHTYYDLPGYWEDDETGGGGR